MAARPKEPAKVQRRFDEMRYLFIFFWLYIPVALSAESRPEIFDRIRDSDLRHGDLLVRMVKDSDTLASVKIRALEKMAVLYRQSPEKAENSVTKFHDAIGTALQNKNPTVREAACSAVVVFEKSTTGSLFAATINKAITEETNPAVLSACAHSLALFPSEAQTTVPVLLAHINRYLVDFRDSSKDEKALIEMCRALKVMRQHKAFIPLLKLLQSRYDEDVKSAAQDALQSIKVRD